MAHSPVTCPLVVTFVQEYCCVCHRNYVFPLDRSIITLFWCAPAPVAVSRNIDMEVKKQQFQLQQQQRDEIIKKTKKELEGKAAQQRQQQPPQSKFQWLHLALIEKPRKMSIAYIFGARATQQKKQQSRESFHQAIFPILLMAQIFALMPVAGIGAAAPTGLKFSWRSIRTVYSLFFVLTGTMAVLFEFYRASGDALNAKSFGTLHL